MTTGRSPSSSALLPMPGAPSSSWAVYRARLSTLLRHADTRTLVAFWLLGLINNIFYVIILSAAQDLVGSLPKGIVLLADVMPSFFLKLVGPYYIHAVPYRLRVPVFIALASAGMLIIALAPSSQSVSFRLAGVVMASLSSGGGELSFLSLLHYYGRGGLVGWGSGTGAAGLVGAGLYEVMTEWWGFGVRESLLFSASLPALMLVSFFFILPQEPLRRIQNRRGYEAVPHREAAADDQAHHQVNDAPPEAAPSALLAPPASAVDVSPAHETPKSHSLRANLRRAKSLFVPYMMPLFLVYIAEYTINQGVAPTLLYPVKSSPFRHLRSFYPFYGFLYQLGVFISRSSVSIVRIRNLYLPSYLQVGNLALLTLHALFYFIPSVYIVFAIVLWEGLLGGCVYVNCFAEILENVPLEDREFSLGAATVSDSAGICTAGFLSIALETNLCDYQVAHGRDWCRRIQAKNA
ncbi:CLN3 protein [Hirsutella rhossiliensis]|uniref:Protein BTN n=1 Tax=Hirsutella rhossiliensis TaxID=111463 RepID=A0A9P8N8Y1_9HYPO|nr:CLN3 protein [Hirsutella rhossiliensis]KAH0968171.1 CLN3 protein [Hirsutella rhossiliensis]